MKVENTRNNIARAGSSNVVQAPMAKQGHLARLKLGAKQWNQWRENNPKETISLEGADLSGAVLSGYNLSQMSLKGVNFAYADLSKATLIASDMSRANLSFCNLRGAKLIAANLSEANLSHSNLRDANLLTTILNQANLSKVDLRGHDMRGQDLRGANLSGTNLADQNLDGQDFTNSDLNHAVLTRASMRNAVLTRANLSDTDMSSCKLEGCNLRYSFMDKAVLRGQNLAGFNLSGAILSNADLRECDLTGARLDEANISGAKLWKVQTKGWSIRNIQCTHASWDEKSIESTHYAQNRFELLFADKLQVALKYDRGLTGVELATLPFLIEHLEAAHWGCVLRLKSIDNTPGNVRVNLIVDDTGSHNPSTLEASLRKEANQLQSIQFSMQSEKKLQLQLRESLSEIKDKFWPRLLELSANEKSEHMRHLTVLFMDLKDFSKWPEKIRHEKLRLFRGLLQPVLKKWDASYPNMEGDSLRATFPNVSAALCCACMAQKVLTGAEFGVRIGLDLGEVRVMHNVVTDQPDLEGEAVNFAARLEAMAESGEVIVSEVVKHYAEQTTEAFEFTARQAKLLKAVGDKKAGDTIVCYSVEMVQKLY